MNPVIDSTIAQVTASKTVMESATILIKSFPTLLDAAVTKALQNGATAAELVPLTELSADFKAKTDDLAAAVLSNTPSAP